MKRIEVKERTSRKIYANLRSKIKFKKEKQTRLAERKYKPPEKTYAIRGSLKMDICQN